MSENEPEKNKEINPEPKDEGQAQEPELEKEAPSRREGRRNPGRHT